MNGAQIIFVKGGGGGGGHASSGGHSSGGHASEGGHAGEGESSSHVSEEGASFHPVFYGMGSHTVITNHSCDTRTVTEAVDHPNCQHASEVESVVPAMAVIVFCGLVVALIMGVVTA